MSTFIIAEAGSSHDNDLQKAYRLIEAAKECGADAVKFQWTSNADRMAKRRYGEAGGICVGNQGDPATNMYRKYLEKPVSWLESLKAHCDKVGIEFMCTVYLIEDIATIAQLVKRFKVSAFESRWAEFVDAHPTDRQVIASYNTHNPPESKRRPDALWCVSKYPTALEDVHLHQGRYMDGFSDHTANVLTGAAAVAAGAKIIESHIRLEDTSPDNPDYPHSLVADAMQGIPDNYMQYIRNIRTVERML